MSSRSTEYMDSETYSDESTQQYIRSYHGTHLTDIGKQMYLNGKTADVHFSFAMVDGTIRRIPAHKSVLAAASDVFEELFYGESKVKGDIRVTDVSEAAFMAFLQFFYLVEVELTIEIIADVMHLGHKYNVTKCPTICVRFLKDVLTVDNIFIGLNLGIRYGLQKLKKFCENLITLNTIQVFCTDSFLECDRQALAHIMKLDVLSCSEVQLFKVCMDWVRAKSKQTVLSKAMVKKHLGDLFYEIRFKSMTMQELCTLQPHYEPVLRSDFANITNMIVHPEFQAENFCNKQRHGNWDANGIIKCDFNETASSETSYKLLNIQTTTFSVTKPLLLGSIVCSKIHVRSALGTRELCLPLPVDVSIFEIHGSNDTNLKLSMEVKMQSTNANNIVLSHPVLIRPLFRYKICIGPFPDQHLFYSHGLKERVHLADNFGMTELHHSNKGKDDGKPIGLVSCLNFNEL